MRSDEALERLFEAERQAAPNVPPGLMERVLADAERVRSEVPRRVRRGALWLLGGLPGLGGLAAAALAGVWIGVAAPDALDAAAGGLLPGGDYLGIADALEQGDG